MASLLIAIIYLSFISLGLPDSLLGSAWPVMHIDVGAQVSAAGIISMIISFCTIISALLSARLLKKFGMGIIVASSVFLTAAAMMAFSFSTSFRQLCVFALPYGFGAGAIDACLNNYVALNLSSRHMSWLHCSWGIGATFSPYIMGFALTRPSGWHGGYRFVAAIQLVLTLVLFIAVPLWKKYEKSGGESYENTKTLSTKQVLKIPGTLPMFIGFMSYCAIETLPIVWASTYFRSVYSLAPEKAARFASLFYIGITVCRALIGIVANRFGDRQLIRYGCAAVIASALLIIIPFRSYIPAVIGFVLVGFGCGPVYPSIVHSAPFNFGKENSSSVIGVQMAFAYMGFTFTPIIFGKIAEATTIRLLPFMIVLFAAATLILTETVNRVVDRRRTVNQ